MKRRTTSTAALANISLTTNRLTINSMFWKTKNGAAIQNSSQSYTKSLRKRPKRMQSVHFQSLNCYPQMRGSEFQPALCFPPFLREMSLPQDLARLQAFRKLLLLAIDRIFPFFQRKKCIKDFVLYSFPNNMSSANRFSFKSNLSTLTAFS